MSRRGLRRQWPSRRAIVTSNRDGSGVCGAKSPSCTLLDCPASAVSVKDSHPSPVAAPDRSSATGSSRSFSRSQHGIVSLRALDPGLHRNVTPAHLVIDQRGGKAFRQRLSRLADRHACWPIGQARPRRPARPLAASEKATPALSTFAASSNTNWPDSRRRLQRTARRRRNLLGGRILSLLSPAVSIYPCSSFGKVRSNTAGFFSRPRRWGGGCTATP